MVEKGIKIKDTMPVVVVMLSEEEMDTEVVPVRVEKDRTWVRYGYKILSGVGNKITMLCCDFGLDLSKCSTLDCGGRYAL